MAEAQAPPSRRFARLQAFRARVRRTRAGRIGWRIVVTLLGVVVIAGGIVLLPLPGPGWLIIFGGLGILATEYEWARRLLRFARAKVSEWTSWLGRQNRLVQVLVGLAGVALLVALVGGAWWIYER
ncbi:MAG TPA: TIGR02611 family protein [Jatrophihabitantaceae bacterium]|jgi:uncharacterized protein (TIGR02611 family)